MAAAAAHKDAPDRLVLRLQADACGQVKRERARGAEVLAGQIQLISLSALV